MPARNPLAEVPPDQFVQARDALARQLREHGDAEGARRIAALRRPSTVLWISNQLGRRSAKAMEELIQSTGRARRAQVEGGTGDDLRDAMRAQREATHRLLADAEQVAADAGLALTLEQRRRIQDTLQAAASSDPEALRQGALEHELSPAGFGALLSGPTAVVAKAVSRKQTFEARAEEQRKRAAENRERQLRQREIRQAELAAQRLTTHAAQLEQHAQRAQNTADQAKAKADAARREASSAEARLLQLRTR